MSNKEPQASLVRNKVLPYSVLIAVCLIVLSGASFLLNTFQQSRQQEEWVSHTWAVKTQLQKILTNLNEIEVGMRGYILTDNQAQLDTYTSAAIQLRSDLIELSHMVRDNSVQSTRVQSLNRTVEDRISFLESVKNDVASKIPRGQIVEKILEARAVRLALRDQIGEMFKAEEDLYEKRSFALERTRGYFSAVLLSVTGINFLMLFFCFWLYQRNVLQNSIAAAEQRRKIEIQRVIGEVALLMRSNIGLKISAENLLRFLAKEYKILAGRVFILSKNQWNHLCQIGSVDDEVTVSGLVLEAAHRQEVSTVNNIPSDYWKISSSLGGSVPSQLIFMPILFHSQLIGVIELASFSRLEQDKMDEIKALQDVIGVSFNAAHSHEKMSDLLEKTQFQAEELQTQHEELQSNNEELEQQARTLEAQQETLNQKNLELEGTQVKLSRKAEDLEKSSRYKSEFLAKMSHELRTPLNSLLILSTILTENKEKNLNAQQLQFAKSIHSAGTDLLLLINDILDLSKIEARKLKLKIDEFSISSLLQGLRHTIEPLAAAKKLSFTEELASPLANLVLKTDRQRLEQILRNFLSNAVKFTDHGGIVIRTTLIEDGKKKSVRFSVIDSGIGVSKDKQGLIFDAFEQGDSSVSRRYGGTGLGLTISRELSHLLGGEINLTSREGKGSEFSVTIPLIFDEALVSPESRAHVYRGNQPAESAEVPLVMDSTFSTQSLEEQYQISASMKDFIDRLDPKNKTILVIEDDEAFRSAVKEMVESYGFVPLEASDGESGLAILGKHKPSAILLDIKLPGVSGMALLEMIKKNPEFRHIPVHMISALDYQHNALKLGALGYLKKPVTTEKIKAALGRIEQVLSQKVKNVLTVEDDDRQASAVSELISGQDVKVKNARSGKSAIQELSQNIYDCVILDLSLPDMTGFDFLEQLSRLDISIPPIIIYTGRDLSVKEETYLRQYSESIIIKGAKSPERLLDEVNLFLHRFESLLPETQREMLTKLRSQDFVFENKTALVVDDDVRNVFALTSALEVKGINVVVAKNGMEALEQLEKHPNIDIVLMDIMMPQMDGYEAMRRIRQSSNEKMKRLPIVALTAKAMKEDHEKCIEAGANDYLPKPIHLDNLMTVLRVWLSSKGFVN